MVLNLSKIKTEALLLICKDLIVQYQSNDENIYGVDEATVNLINYTTENILQAINSTIHQHSYYIKNARNSRIKAIITSYEFISKELGKELVEGKPFNPAMLYFALLATWFAELEHEKTAKDYIYFTLYPYAQVYDTLLINQTNTQYKALNISMINIAEKVIENLHNYRNY
ncbi:MAG: hypothetical protein U9N30_07710 [Campylobacterota bacterium]|nr:hypothetical protein [Campylobacterota bacterium]